MVETIHTQVAYNSPEVSKDKEKTQAEEKSDFSFFGDDGVSFLDFVDMINPLQHIPLVSTAYRAITGDEIDPGSRLIGGTLFGGPIGLAASAFNVILQNETGKDAGEHIFALFEGDEVPAEETQTAQNEPAPNPMVNGFAPLDSEKDALAAGDASLRMADLYEFMNTDSASQVPLTTDKNKGAGSAGTWAPAQTLNQPFTTQRAKTPDFSSYRVASPPNAAAQAQAQLQPSTQPVFAPSAGFEAKQSYDQSVESALQAFARDMQMQKAQQDSPQPTPPAPVPPLTTSSLNQTNDNAWFTEMMSQNMERYNKQPDRRTPPQG